MACTNNCRLYIVFFACLYLERFTKETNTILLENFFIKYHKTRIESSYILFLMSNFRFLRAYETHNNE